MADKVILHVGPPKTGTTYLQRTLWDNRDVLARSGVELPLGDRWRQSLAAASLCDPRWDDRPGAGTWTWQRFVSAAADAQGVALLSDEVLALATEDHVAEAIASLAPAEVHVVVTVRDLGRMIPSMWQQDVKYRETRPLEAYVRWLREDPASLFWFRQDPAAVLRRWARHVPADRLHVVTVPPSGTPEGVLWERFASVLGVSCAVEEPAADGLNRSSTAAEVEVIRRLNVALGDRLPVPQPYVRAVRFSVVPELAGNEQGSGRIGLDPAWSGWLADRTDQLTAELRALGVDLVGDWEDLSPAPARGFVAPDEDEVTAVAVATLAGMAVRHEGGLSQVAELTEALAADKAMIRTLRKRVRRLHQRVESETKLVRRRPRWRGWRARVGSK